MRKLSNLLCLLALWSPVQAFASETVTYSYDAKGRLTQVRHAGGSASGQVTTYQFDAADNRTGTQVSGAPSPVIVVPLGSIRVIPIH